MLSAKTKGVIAIIMSAFGFALMGFFVRLADDYGGVISSFQKSFFRNLVAFVIALFVFVKSRRLVSSNRLHRHNNECHPCARWSIILILLIRSILGTIGIFANFFALSHVPIAEAQTLNKTAPFFTVFFAWIFLGERIVSRQVITLVLAFVGALFVAKPGFAGLEALPLLLGLLSGACAGCAYACVRALRTREVLPSLIILVFSAFSCVAALPFIFAHYDSMTIAQLLILLGAGGGAALGQFGITLAYGYAAPREIAVYDYTSILFSAALGYAFFAQVPDLWSVLGFVAIIFAACRLKRGRTCD